MADNKGHNKPPLLVELDEGLSDFIIHNCDSNIEFGLGALQFMSEIDGPREKAKTLVEALENFKKLKEAVNKAKAERDG